ncbi:hypothetical protein [Tenacibaculum aiptasiae]|uniref:hypothetical protein n=1 Tax=Tenacibaculum aiptasiae TaxID=426481 RepID=UPI003B5A6E82
MKSFKIILVLLSIFSITEIHSQQNGFPKLSFHERAKIDSISSINFLDYPYKYIDKDYKINISSEEFKKAYLKYPMKISNYNDSISLITMYEFNDWTASRIASYRINFKWETLGYYIWKSANESKIFAKKLGIKRPYKVYKLLIDDNNNQLEVVDFFSELAIKMNHSQETFESRKNILKRAFRNNPDRLKHATKFHNKRHLERKNRKKKRDSIKKINFLNKKYSFLDNEFNITISSYDFDNIINETLKKQYFPKSEIKTYEDSLNIVVFNRIKNKMAARELLNQILKNKKKNSEN